MSAPFSTALLCCLGVNKERMGLEEKPGGGPIGVTSDPGGLSFGPEVALALELWTDGYWEYLRVKSVGFWGPLGQKVTG